MGIKRKMSQNKRWDILGIGSPLLDIVINISEDMLHQLGLRKGSMKLISEKESRNILKKFKRQVRLLSPGGSASNMLSGASILGNRVSLLGVVGQDEYGKMYQEKIEAEGIVSQLACCGNSATGHAIILVTPDGERTMATHLGAALGFTKEHIRGKEDEIRNSKILHVEAYEMDSPDTCQAVLYAIKIAKDNKTLISMDLSDAGLIRRNKKLFQKIVREHVDIVFANEQEAIEFTNKKNPVSALRTMAKLCAVAVVKLGEKGSLIKKGGDIFNIQPRRVSVVNTNGAGDTYAAGILHGLINGLKLQDAGDIASYISALVVASPGSRLSKKYINSISKYKKHARTRL